MRSRLAAIASLVVLISYLLLSFSHYLIAKVESLDESIQLMSGFLVFRGFVPHKDFWSMYTPLNYYLNSFIFSLLGVSAVSARILQVFFHCLLVVAFYFAFKKSFAAQRSAFALNLAVVSAILTANIFTFAWWNAYAIGFLGLLLYLLNQNKLTVFLAVSGLLVGLSCLAKLNMGMYVFAAILIGFLIEIMQKEKDRRGALHAALYFLAPVFLCFLAYLIPYGASAKEVVNQILLFPSKGLEQHRILSLPAGLNGYGTLFAAVFPLIWMGVRSVMITSRWDRCSVLAFLSAFLSLLILFAIGTRFQQFLPKFFLVTGASLTVLQIIHKRLQTSEFTLLMAYVFFTNYFLSRIDPVHFSVLLPLAIALSVFILQQPNDSNVSFPGRLSRYSAAVMILALCASPAYWHLKAILDEPRKDLVNSCALLKERMQNSGKSDSDLLLSDRGNSPLTLLYPKKMEVESARFVASQTVPEDPVYVGLQDHSNVYMSPMRLYWIVGRNIGVKHFLLEPGLTTEESIQREMIQDLESKQVIWMILRRNRTGDADFEIRNYRGAKVLDQYIHANYEPFQAYEGYSVYKRKSDSHK